MFHLTKRIDVPAGFKLIRDSNPLKTPTYLLTIIYGSNTYKIQVNNLINVSIMGEQDEQIITISPNLPDVENFEKMQEDLIQRINEVFKGLITPLKKRISWKRFHVVFLKYKDYLVLKDQNRNFIVYYPYNNFNNITIKIKITDLEITGFTPSDIQEAYETIISLLPFNIEDI